MQINVATNKSGCLTVKWLLLRKYLTTESKTKAVRFQYKTCIYFYSFCILWCGIRRIISGPRFLLFSFSVRSLNAIETAIDDKSNANVSYVLNFRILVLLKSAVIMLKGTSTPTNE